MNFHSIHFIIFLSLVLLLYYLIKPRFRWIMLLAASYYFYMCWRVEYIFLILLSTITDYAAGIMIARSARLSVKRVFLFLSLAVNLGLLFFFKYYGFIGSNLQAVFNHFNILYQVREFNILLPVGISFYTFQTLSYTIDVYRGKKEPEYHLGYFALYVAYFPQLVAGPIERSARLLPQLKKYYELNCADISAGIKQITWGFFKKLVVADRMAIYVDAVYNNQAQHSGLSLLMASFFFYFQIYCDFSAYSDIAIGSARLMGVRLSRNFHRPHLVLTITEFWQRWHITMSNWFRDYLYIPLVQRQRQLFFRIFFLIFTFAVIGFWHGANWTFVAFGLWHGIFLSLDRLILHIKKLVFGNSVPRFTRFLDYAWLWVIIIFSITFFRGNSISDSWTILGKISCFERPLFIGQGDVKVSFLYSFLAIAMLTWVEIRQEFFPGSFSFLENKNQYVRMAAYASLVIIIMALGVLDGSQFIYFQF